MQGDGQHAGTDCIEDCRVSGGRCTDRVSGGHFMAGHLAHAMPLDRNDLTMLRTRCLVFLRRVACSRDASLHAAWHDGVPPYEGLAGVSFQLVSNVPRGFL